MTESQFAADCETIEYVKYYFKLPEWFKIPTPVGNYNPDWAVVFENDKRVYFIVETKNTGTEEPDLDKLYPNEKKKILCGNKHFDVMNGVVYEVVSKAKHLY
ncbi:MAG: hypothetical protein IJV27_03700 [Prevotella sp.]|nr:hypothetical protein [Prevotella sp.]